MSKTQTAAQGGNPRYQRSTSQSQCQSNPGSQCGETSDWIGQLRNIMDDEMASARFYTELAKFCGKQTAQKLRQVASEEMKHLKSLQMEYFLLTGDSYTPKTVNPTIQSPLAGLRSAYLAEKQAYDTYMEAAQSVSSTSLAAVYVANAADEARHAMLMRSFISKAI